MQNSGVNAWLPISEDFTTKFKPIAVLFDLWHIVRACAILEKWALILKKAEEFVKECIKSIKSAYINVLSRSYTVCKC